MQRQAHEDRPGNSEDSQRIAGTTRPGKVEVRPAFACPIANKGSKQTPFEVRTPKNIKKNFFALERPSEPMRNFIFALERPSEPMRNFIFALERPSEPTRNFIFALERPSGPTRNFIFALERPSGPMKKFIFALIVSPRTSNFVVSYCEM